MPVLDPNGAPGAAILKLVAADGTSIEFYTYARLNPDDGFDPADGDHLEPRFAESAVGPGEPLISIRERNREMQWPVHLLAGKDPAYGNTKDELHRLTRDVHKFCRRAVRAEWRDESATWTTYLDVVSARFEPAPHHRKAQKNILSGVVRIWTLPYGHTGTSRLIATAAGTGIALAVSLPTGLDGDVPALSDILVQVGSQALRDGRITGVAVIPSGYLFDWPAASMVRLSGATVVGASGAAGSQVIDPTGWTTPGAKLVEIHLTPASMYQGRNRVLAVAQDNSPLQGPLELRGYDGDDRPLTSWQSLATVLALDGWGTCDLGVLSVEAHRATAVLRIAANLPNGKLNRILVLPEDRLALTVDTPRRPLAGLSASSLANTASGRSLTIDEIGNPLSTPRVASRGLLTNAGGQLQMELTGANDVGGVLTGHPTAIDLSLSQLMTLVFDGGTATMVVAAGKQTSLSGGGGVFARVVRHANGSQSFSLAREYFHLASSLLIASTLLPLGAHTLHVRTQGPVVSAKVIGLPGGGATKLAELTGSAAVAAQPGQAVFGVSHASMLNPPQIGDLQVAGVPSAAFAPRDRVSYLGASRAVLRMSSASVVTGHLDAYQRGAIPDLDPAVSERLVAFHLPLDGGATNDLLSAEIRVTERWTYAR